MWQKQKQIIGRSSYLKNKAIFFLNELIFKNNFLTRDFNCSL